MKKTAILLLSGFLFVLTGCQKDDKLEKRLEGNWNVARFQNMKIFNDGTIETISDVEDAGYFNFYYDAYDLSVFDFSYTTSTGTQSGSLVYYMIDDHAQRIIIIGGQCIGCDLAYTIEENSKNRQVWTIYELHQTGTSTDYVYKLKLELER